MIARKHEPDSSDVDSTSRAWRETDRRRTTFGATLRSLMSRPRYDVTPGLLAKLSGVSKATIVNWVVERVATPRSVRSVAAICDALRLDDVETKVLYESAGLIAPKTTRDVSAFDRVPVGLYSTTVDGRILSANSTLVAMLGYDRATYFTLDVARDLYADPAARTVWLEEIARAGTLVRWPVVARRADGTTLDVLDTCNAVRDDAGRIARFDGLWEETPLGREAGAPDRDR